MTPSARSFNRRRDQLRILQFEGGGSWLDCLPWEAGTSESFRTQPLAVGGEVGPVQVRWGLESPIVPAAVVFPICHMPLLFLMNSSDAIVLGITGSVLRGASAVADSGITLDIDGDHSGNFVAGSVGLTGTIDGSVTNGNPFSSHDIPLTVGRGIVQSVIAADNDLDLAVTGAIANSRITRGHSQINLNVTGNVTNPRVAGELTGTVNGSVSGTRFVAGNFDDVTLTVNGNLANSQIETDDEISVNVTGRVTNSRLASTTGGVTLTVGTDLLSSTLVSADDDIILSVGRDFRGLAPSGSGDLIMTVGGSVLNSSWFLNGDTATVRAWRMPQGELLRKSKFTYPPSCIGAKARENVI